MLAHDSIDSAASYDLLNSNAMDANWIPTQGSESTRETSDWRTQLQPDSRQRIVNKIMDTLKRHLPVSGQDGLHELRRIVQRFEEKIYTAATSQSDYHRKISLKMLTMENKTQNTMVNPTAGPSNKPIDSASLDSTAQTGKSGGDDSQEEVYQKQQFKSWVPSPVSSPLLQAVSPQIPQHSSLQIDQQNLPSLAEVSIPLQSANSPFVGPTPSPPLAPSPMPGDSEKRSYVVLSVSDFENNGHQIKGIATVPAQSFAKMTRGKSSLASALLAESLARGNALAVPYVMLTAALLCALLWLAFVR